MNRTALDTDAAAIHAANVYLLAALDGDVAALPAWLAADDFANLRACFAWAMGARVHQWDPSDRAHRAAAKAVAGRAARLIRVWHRAGGTTLAVGDTTRPVTAADIAGALQAQAARRAA